MDKRSAPESVIGCLIGTSSGLRVDIHDVYEFPYRMKKDKGGFDVLDVTYVDDEKDDDERDDDYVAVFDQCRNLALEVHKKEAWEVVGWFSYMSKSPTSDEERKIRNQNDLRLNEQFKGLLGMPRLLFLRLYADGNEDDEELPIDAFEDCGGVLSPVRFTIHSDRAEGVAMGHIEKMKAPENGLPPLVGRLQEMKVAMKKLQDRIRVVRHFLEDTKKSHKDGKAIQSQLLRKVATVMNQLPSLDSANGLNESFLREQNDAQLVAYLAVATKLASRMGVVLEKSNVAARNSHEAFDHRM